MKRTKFASLEFELVVYEDRDGEEDSRTVKEIKYRGFGEPEALASFHFRLEAPTTRELELLTQLTGILKQLVHENDK